MSACVLAKMFVEMFLTFPKTYLLLFHYVDLQDLFFFNLDVHVMKQDSVRLLVKQTYISHSQPLGLVTPSDVLI